MTAARRDRRVSTDCHTRRAKSPCDLEQLRAVLARELAATGLAAS
ncbi:MAG: hypothetical protein WAN26_09690 [Steroidobacteraceae bacterium]